MSAQTQASRDPESSDAAVELTLNFHRTSDGSSHTDKLLLPPGVRTVADVKTSIQKKFSIPVCQQRVSLNNLPLNDAQEVEQLYIRHQDSLAVTYYREADVGFFEEFMGGGLQPLVTRLQASPELVSRPWSEVEEDLQDLITGCDGQFHSATYTLLMPWESSTAESNRQFVIQQGGVEAILRLYALLQTVPWEQRSNQLQSLEVSCLSFLWNFGETTHARKVVVEGGGFDMMVRSLLVYSDEDYLQKYCIHWVFDSAVGALSK